MISGLDFKIIHRGWGWGYSRSKIGREFITAVAGGWVLGVPYTILSTFIYVCQFP